MTPVPILLYHSVSRSPSPAIAPFTVTPDAFEEQLDCIAGLGCSTLTVGALARALAGGGAALPERPVVITFDDGYADFGETALAALRSRGLASTLYLATALLSGRPREPGAPRPLGRTLDWSELGAIAAAGVEIGGHSHTHPHLDTLAAARARDEIERCKALLEDELQAPVETFAYPNGYSSKPVRRLTREAGYLSACAVKNALSSTRDDVFALARLTVRSTTTLDELRAWLDGRGARTAPYPERLETRAWRAVRRARALATGAPGSDLTGPEAAFEPLRVVEVELAGADVHVPAEGPDGRTYSRALLVATMQGVPIGTVETELPAEASRVARAALGDTAPRDDAPPPAATVTVAVATRDRPDELRGCLRSLEHAGVRDVIVVDSAPARASADVVAESNADYVLEPRPGLARAHNTALARARGEIVAFVDDDVVVHPGWLDGIARAFALGDDVGCVTGPIVPAELETRAQALLEEFGGFAKGFERRVIDLENGHGAGALHPYAAGRFGSGANMAFRTGVLRELGGFDEAIGAGTPARGGDDLAAFFAVVASGRKIVYEPGALVYHRHRREYAALRRTVFGYGVGLAAYLTKTVADEPARLLDVAARAPRGIRYVLGPGSAKNRKKEAGYPRELALIELAGMLVGPFAYLRSRRRP